MRRADAAAFGLALALLHAVPAAALSTDREQPIHLEADRVEIDDLKGTSVYSGNVRYTQGTMHLDADTLSIHYDQAHKFEGLEAEGQPARFRMRPDDQDEDMLGEAMRIEYTAQPEQVVLRQKAHIWNQGDEFAGDLITYEVATDRVTARRGEGTDERVHVVIQPRTPAAGTSP